MPPISKLGSDAFRELMNFDEFIEYLSSKKISIKGLLLNYVQIIFLFIVY